MIFRYAAWASWRLVAPGWKRYEEVGPSLLNNPYYLNTHVTDHPRY